MVIVTITVTVTTLGAAFVKFFASINTRTPNTSKKIIAKVATLKLLIFNLFCPFNINLAARWPSVGLSAVYDRKKLVRSLVNLQPELCREKLAS